MCIPCMYVYPFVFELYSLPRGGFNELDISQVTSVCDRNAVIIRSIISLYGNKPAVRARDKRHA